MSSKAEQELSRETAAGATNLLYWVFRFGVFLSGVLPARFGYWLCRRGGDIAYYLLPARRRVTAENLGRVMGMPWCDGEVLSAVRKALRNYGAFLYDSVRFSHQTTQQILDRVTPHDLHHLSDALARGKGVIFVSAHFGSMEVAAVTVATTVAPMTIPGTTLEPPRLMQDLVRQRAEKGMHMSLDSNAARDILKALRRNETVGFLVDLGAEWKGDGIAQVSFFGSEAPFPTVAALLALKTGAAIVPGYAVMRPDHSVDAYALPAIIPEANGDKEQDARHCLQRIANSLEVFIRQHPEQWYMFRPMWPSEASSGTCAAGAA